jgi:hypothetical protein
VLLNTEEDWGLAEVRGFDALVEALGVRRNGWFTEELSAAASCDEGRLLLLPLPPIIFSALGEVREVPRDPLRTGRPSTPR